MRTALKASKTAVAFAPNVKLTQIVTMALFVTASRLAAPAFALRGMVILAPVPMVIMIAANPATNPQTTVMAMMTMAVPAMMVLTATVAKVVTVQVTAKVLQVILARGLITIRIAANPATNPQTTVMAMMLMAAPAILALVPVMVQGSVTPA